MLLAEAVIAEILAALFVGYSSIKHIRGSEGVAVAALISKRRQTMESSGIGLCVLHPLGWGMRRRIASGAWTSG
jgi:hypothetical protein